MTSNTSLDEPADYVVSVHPFWSATVAAVTGIGIAGLPCLGSDTNPRLSRISDVIATYDMWVATTAEVRNNPRVLVVKDALADLLQCRRRSLQECRMRRSKAAWPKRGPWNEKRGVSFLS